MITPRAEERIVDETSVESETEKKPYERPRILYRESLEALAISCTAPGGKGDPINCPVFAAS